MDVVLVATEFFKFNVISLANFLRYVVNGERDVVVEESFAVFDGKDDVIVSIVYIVVSAGKGHALSLSGNQGFLTFLSGPRGKPRGKACGYSSNFTEKIKQFPPKMLNTECLTFFTLKHGF